jgi:hypothetical protein
LLRDGESGRKGGWGGKRRGREKGKGKGKGRERVGKGREEKGREGDEVAGESVCADCEIVLVLLLLFVCAVYPRGESTEKIIRTLNRHDWTNSDPGSCSYQYVSTPAPTQTHTLASFQLKSIRAADIFQGRR